ncbi:putative membrane protein [Lactococcus cremoris subsp. cremoris MG1363]|uniref:Putative membrane protein n=1 Tax=Lactococcus lactis subsp. cremoris (strain MG1363) TaxID=416870 RepID=A2RJ48_LACLM|nr:putative membrane protein [Lactococcus cremoris subsp. cremoris MG1363]
MQKFTILGMFMNFLNITRNKGKAKVLEEIIKAVIILKTAFIIVLFFMLLCFGLFILY